VSSSWTVIRGRSKSLKVPYTTGTAPILQTKFLSQRLEAGFVRKTSAEKKEKRLRSGDVQHKRGKGNLLQKSQIADWSTVDYWWVSLGKKQKGGTTKKWEPSSRSSKETWVRSVLTCHTEKKGWKKEGT